MPGPFSKLSFFRNDPQYYLYLDRTGVCFSRVKSHLGQNIFLLEVLNARQFKDAAGLSPGTPEETEVFINSRLTEIIESRKVPAGSMVIIGIGPVLSRQLIRAIPAVSLEEIPEYLPLEIEEETGQPAGELVWAWRTEGNISEKGVPKIKIRIAILSRTVFDKIISIFHLHKLKIRVISAPEENNSKKNYLKMGEMLEFKETQPWTTFTIFRKFSTPAIFLALGVLTGISLLKIAPGKKLPPTSESDENQTEISLAAPEITRIIPAQHQSTTATAPVYVSTASAASPDGSPIFTYATADLPLPLASLRLAGIATGAVPAAILQNGADINLKYPGDQLAPGLKITEIFPDKISATDKSGRIKNFSINEEIN